MAKPKTYKAGEAIVQAIQVKLLNMGAIEKFVGGDLSNTSLGLVVATKQGPLRVQMGSYLIRNPDDTFFTATPEEFEANFKEITDE